jgi:anti-anti-sigma factor
MPVSLPPLIDMTVVWDGRRWRIIVRGELDLRSGQELEDMAGVLDPKRGVDIDLGAVTFVDTAGWHAVASARAQVQGAGGASDLVAVSPAVTRYLDLAGAGRTGFAGVGLRPAGRRQGRTRCVDRRRRPRTPVGPT